MRDTPVPASGPLGLAGLLCCANVGRFADGWDIGGPFAWLVHDDAVVVTPERAAHYGDREHPPVRSAARQGAPHRSCEHWRGERTGSAGVDGDAGPLADRPSSGQPGPRESRRGPRGTTGCRVLRVQHAIAVGQGGAK